MTVKTRMRLMIRKRGIDFFVFQFTALKLGYWNRLNIIKERKSNNGGRTNFQLPRRCSPSASQRRNNVMDAMSPAAAGIGKPVKFLLFSVSVGSGLADAGLNRATRTGPEVR